MSVTAESKGDLTIIKVDGDLAGANVEELRSIVQECLDRDRRDFYVDLSASEVCTSAGLETLTWLQRECEERLGLVKLCSVSDTLNKILELTRLNNRFERDSDVF